MTKDEMKEFLVRFIRSLGDPREKLKLALDIAFSTMDTDENGLIDKKEFRYAFRKAQL